MHNKGGTQYREYTVLCSDYPSIIVPDSLATEVKKAANDKKQASAFFLLRMLICSIFSDDQIWSDLTSKQRVKNHDSEVNAC